MINQIMLDDIKAQPEVLSKIVPVIRAQIQEADITHHHWKRMIFTGSGDSYFGPLALQYLLRKELPFYVEARPSLEVAGYSEFTEDDLIIPISFSGETKRTVEAALSAKEQGAKILSITGNSESSLGRMSDNIVHIVYNSESRSIPHTIDFTTTLLTITLLGESFGKETWAQNDRISELVGTALSESLEKVISFSKQLAENENFFILGAGPNWGVSIYGAAKLWEACGIMAHAYELEEFAHGPHKLVQPGDPVMILGPQGPSYEFSRKVTQGLTELNMLPILISDEIDSEVSPALAIQIPKVEEEWSPFLTSVPLQVFAYAIATAKGYDVVDGNGRIQNIKKYRAIQRSWIR
jgi:glucosamine--fructose-6-phosphate aminotransferase (isomerizing)